MYISWLVGCLGGSDSGDRDGHLMVTTMKEERSKLIYSNPIVKIDCQLFSGIRIGGFDLTEI